MTREEIIRNLKYTMKKHENDRVDTFGTNISLMCKDILDYLEQEPWDDIAQERYKDLCEYFGGAKDILKSREDFKAWLGRVKWHIRKAEELYEKYEYKQEPYEDAVSRKKVEEITWDEPSYTDALNVLTEVRDKVRALPSVTRQSGEWIHLRGDMYECSKCRKIYTSFEIGECDADYCPKCGAKMVEPQESEEV